MQSLPHGHSRSFVVFTISVCAAAAIIAGFMGYLARLLYVQFADNHVVFPPFVESGGIIAGVVGGLAAGLIWCRVMIPLALANPRRRLTLWGALAGICAGMLSTLFLHLVLMLTVVEWNPQHLLIGVQFGIPIGAVLGAICGYILLCVVDAEVHKASARRRHRPTPADSPDDHPCN